MDDFSKDDRDRSEEEYLKLLGQIYTVSKLDQWSKSYNHLEGFVQSYQKEWLVGAPTESSMSIYDEMMDAAQEALVTEGDYDNEFNHIYQAFVYGSENSPSIEEFRETVKSILEKETSWEDHLQD